MTLPTVGLIFLGDEVFELLQRGDLAEASLRSQLDLPRAFVTSESWLWPVFRAKIAADPEAEAVVDRCLNRDLSWYATQEIGDLLAQ